MQAGDLRIASRSSEPQPVLLGNVLRLDGRVTWLVEGPADALARVAADLGRFATPFGGSLLLEFGQAVGRFPFACPPVSELEVVSGKLDEAAFDWMLADLTEACAALPFTAAAAGSLPYEIAAELRRQALYHAFAYLRAVLSPRAPREQRLLPALDAVFRTPHRRMTHHERRIEPHLATRVDLERVIGSAADGALHRVPWPASETPLAQALHGHLPERVPDQRARSTFDTAENRLVRAFLDEAIRIVDAVVRLAGHRGSSASLQAWVARDAAMMRPPLARARAHGLFATVGRLAHVPAASPVLQRHAGYREVYRHFLRLHAGVRLPLDPPAARRLLEVKDLATLYELWCYVAVARGITRTLGAPAAVAPPPSASWKQAALSWGHELRWAEGARLVYNAHFSRQGPGYAYSTPLRPDIALYVARGPAAGLHLFDAKLRVRQVGPSPGDDGPDAHDPGLLTHSFQKSDVHKMHAYRDAIEAVRSARVLYPGTDAGAFYEAGQGSARGADGVGALPLRPTDGGDAALLDVLASLLGRAPAPRPVGALAART